MPLKVRFEDYTKEAQEKMLKYYNVNDASELTPRMLREFLFVLCFGGAKDR